MGSFCENLRGAVVDVDAAAAVAAVDGRKLADFPMVRDGGIVSKDDNVSASSPAAPVVAVGLLPLLLLDANGDPPRVACSQSSISTNVGDVAVPKDDE